MGFNLKKRQFIQKKTLQSTIETSVKFLKTAKKEAVFRGIEKFLVKHIGRSDIWAKTGTQGSAQDLNKPEFL